MQWLVYNCFGILLTSHNAPLNVKPAGGGGEGAGHGVGI